jgi:hypothetical protein
MAIYGNLRDYHFDQGVDDIRGADVYGVDDEKLGEIDDVIFDSNTGDLKYVVVDTGGWLSSRKFLVDALRLTIREEGDEDYYINMTKEQIERLPEYDEERLKSDQDWGDYESRYSKSIDDGPVMHVTDSTHMITPEPSQVESVGTAGSSAIDPAAATPRRIARDLPRFGATSTPDSGLTGASSLNANNELEPASPLASATTPERRGTDRGRRFDDFQERLRREREEILRRRAA